MNENHKPRFHNDAMMAVSQRNLLMTLLKRYYTQNDTGPDPRKYSKERKPRKTDAPTGYGYFFGDKNVKTQYVTFDPDISTTPSLWRHMHRLGFHTCDESFPVFHARMVKERDEKLS